MSKALYNTVLLWIAASF